MRIPKDQLEVYFEYGVDIANRCVFLTDEIDDQSIGHVVKGLYLMENQSKEYTPIELRIASYGGDICDMFGLHDVTRTLKSPVHTMGMGKVMSAAVLLVACGERNNRWAGDNTSFMIHLPWDDWGKKNLAELDHDIRYTKELWDRWYKLMAEYTKMPEKHWCKLCSKQGDAFFFADDALKWGIIDHIWDEKGGE